MDNYLTQLIEELQRTSDHWTYQALWGYTLLFERDDPAIQPAKQALREWRETIERQADGRQRPSDYSPNSL